MKNLNVDPRTCPLCLKIYSSKSKVKRHLNTVHNKPTTTTGTDITYSCDQCSKCFIDKDSLKKHKKKKHGGKRKPYNCQICQAAFSQKMNLTKHIQFVHQGIKEYSCHLCYKSFAFESNLKLHYSRNACAQLYSCTKCDQNFDSETDLCNHMNVDHAKKKSKRVCSMCNQIFESKSLLREHKKIHQEKSGIGYNKLKPFSCELCGKPFAVLENLNKHKISAHVKKVNVRLKVIDYAGDVESIENIDYEELIPTHKAVPLDIKNSSGHLTNGTTVILNDDRTVAEITNDNNEFDSANEEGESSKSEADDFDQQDLEENAGTVVVKKSANGIENLKSVTDEGVCDLDHMEGETTLSFPILEVVKE